MLTLAILFNLNVYPTLHNHYHFNLYIHHRTYYYYYEELHARFLVCLLVYCYPLSPQKSKLRKANLLRFIYQNKVFSALALYKY